MMPVRIKIKDDIWGEERVSGHSSCCKFAFWTATLKKKRLNLQFFLPDTFASTNSCLILFWLFLFYGFSSGKKNVKMCRSCKNRTFWHCYIPVFAAHVWVSSCSLIVRTFAPASQRHFATWILYWLSQLPCDVTHLESVSSNKPPLEKKCKTLWINTWIQTQPSLYLDTIR